MVTNTRRCHVVFALTASLLAPVQAQDKALNTPMGFQTEVTAKMRGATVSFDYGNGNPERIRSLLKAVLVTKPDGPALTIIDDRAFHDEACGRANAGIAVVANNVNNSEGAGAAAAWSLSGKILSQPVT